MSEAPILYAEDDENDVFLVSRAFKKAALSGLQVVPDGRAAIDYLTRAMEASAANATPRLVLLDLNMPFKSGLEVLSWIRTQPSYISLPVLIFTSSNQEKDIASAYVSGATAYLVKPSAAEKLVELAKILHEACAAGEFNVAAVRTLASYQPRPKPTVTAP